MLKAKRSKPSKSNKNDDGGQVVTMKKMGNDWSDLPQEIVRLIMEKWCRSDYRYGFARLTRYESMLICKSWQIPDLHDIPISTGMDLFPWLLCYNWGYTRRNDWKEPERLLCKLIDPCMQKNYTLEVKNTIQNKSLKKVRNVFIGAEAVASSYGWVLFSKTSSNSTKSSYFFNLFLYNPFTNETIELPVLPIHQNRRTSHTISFSVNPSSPECVVFVVLNDYEHLEFRTYRLGDKTWMNVKYKARFQDFLTHVVYAGGFFYCAFPFQSGVLGVFDVNLQEFKLLLDERRKPYSDRGPAGPRLVSSSTGDIIMAGPNYRIFWRFDLSEKQWVEVKNENVTFVNDSTLSLHSFSVPTLGSTKEFACHVYSLTSFYGNKLPQCYSDCITDMNDHLLNKIWVDPPRSGIWKAQDLLQFRKSFN